MEPKILRCSNNINYLNIYFVFLLTMKLSFHPLFREIGFEMNMQKYQLPSAPSYSRPRYLTPFPEKLLQRSKHKGSGSV